MARGASFTRTGEASAPNAAAAKIRSYLLQHFIAVAVQERGHRVAVNRLTGAVGAVVPALRDALLGQPRDLLVELAVGRNIRKRRPGGAANCGEPAFR